MATILLGANEYALAVDQTGHPVIKHTYAPRQSNPLRLTGVTTRTDDPSIGHYYVKQFLDGIGWARLDRLTGRGVSGLLDSTADTRFWPTTLGRLHESQSHAAAADHPKAYANFASDFWGFFEEDYGTTNTIVARKFGGTSDDWTGGGNIGSGGGGSIGARIWDAVVHKASLRVLHSGRFDEAGDGTTEERYFSVASSVDGVTWTAMTNRPAGNANLVSSTTITRRNNFDDDEGKLLSFGNLLFAAVYDGATDSQIECYSTSDAGATAWTAQGTTRDRNVHALVVWRDPTATTVQIAVLVTNRNVYKVNTTANTLDPLLPDGVLTGDANDGRGAVVGLDGNLYVPLGSGPILKLRLRGDNQIEIIRIGPPGDGLVTARLGHVNDMIVVPEDYLIVAYGGHAASRNASIFAIEYKERIDPTTGKVYQPWHSIYYEDDANIDLYLLGYSTEDDNTGRLHFALENATSAEMFHIEEFLTHPEASTTIKYQATSILRLPVDDFGDPQVSKTIIQARVNAASLTAGSGGSGGATDEFITMQYGLDEAADTTTTLGDFLSGQLTLNFGSSAGVAATTMGTRLTLDRGSTNTNRPLLREFEILAEQKLLGPRRWDFTIDIAATVKAAGPTKVANTQLSETIISNLETATEAGTLSAFRAGGMSANANVRVPNDSPPIFNLWVVVSTNRERGYRTGFVTMRLQEML